MIIDFKIKTGTDLTTAFEAVASHMEQNGSSVHRNEFTDGNPNNPLCGIARSFQIFPDEGPPVWGYVYVGNWSDDDTFAFLNTAYAQGDSVSDLLLISAEPVPEILQFLFSTEPCALFCLKAMATLDVSQLAQQEGPKFAEEFAAATAKLMTDFFAERISIDTAQLSQIDDLILKKLRSVEDVLADQPGYVPEVGLIGLGCLAGEIMLREVRSDNDVKTAFWKKPDESMTRFGLVVDIQSNSGGSIVINPIGKAFKVFQDGDGDSLEFMFTGSMNLLRMNQ